jgi:hypothetical protein
VTTRRRIARALEGKTRTALNVRCGAAPCVESLRANTTRSLRPAACGLELRCLWGLVLVTQQGDRDDHALHPGDAFRTSSRGLVVAWAFQDSGFTVKTAADALGTRRAA